MNTIRKTKSLANTAWNARLPFGAMKCGLFGVVMLLGFASAGNAIAAKDDALIVATRKNQMANDANGKQIAANDTTQKKLALPLDHGPRAEVTPWVNEQRRLRAKRDGQ